MYRWTAFFGITLFVLMQAEVPLYFTYTPTPSGTPPPNIILSRILIDLFIVVGLIGFFSGFKHIITEAKPAYAWMGTFSFALGSAFAIASLVADSIQAGGLWLAGDNPVNPTAVGQGADGALLIYGPINRLLMAGFLIIGGTAVRKIGLAPAWLGWLAYVFALYNLAFIPTLFYMTTPLDFYSVNGWNIPIAAGLFFLWVLLISIFFLRKKANMPNASS
ncbi:hypothetical protein Halhy_0708 [Haliscomenobacter hydrossis DSM 1100]|uniref:DUF998 domain-containing protein n=2 Tax=Haliscomenobacter TaxID=2349 RepID=F4L2Q2_HALH1|nr:hypothetical protein Halhy_0708 [Haliscomenobacter hydrossis DSM 1100]